MDAAHSETAAVRSTHHEPYAPATARGRATRQRLLDAAIAEFGEKGFHAASVSAITTRAGIGQGTFYIYFSSKEACYAVVVESISRLLRRALLRGFSHLDLESCLRESFAAYLRFCAEQPAAVRALGEAQFIDESIWREHTRRLVHCYTDLLERHAGADTPHTERELHATAIVGALHGAAQALIVTLEDSTDEPASLISHQANGLRDVALYGVGPRPHAAHQAAHAL